MVTFTREQKGKAFDALPKEIKSVVTSGVLAQAFQDIGKENGLAIDKTGILADLVTNAILGLIPRQNLQSEIASSLGLNPQDAGKLVKTVNDRIFLQIREILRKQQEIETSEESEAEEPESEIPTEQAPVLAPAEPASTPNIIGIHDIDKDAILAEIEKPAAVTTTASDSAAVAHDFIAEKLNATVNLPSQKVVNPAPQPKPKPQSYSADPYREPLA